MEPDNEFQRTVADFVNVTVKDALNGLADEINAGDEFTAEVRPEMPTRGLGRVTFVVRAVNPNNPQRDSIFVFVVSASPMGDSARVHFEGQPMEGGEEGKTTAKGDLHIPGVAVSIDATVRQVRDYVRTLAEAAMEGHRDRKRMLKSSA